MPIGTLETTTHIDTKSDSTIQDKSPFSVILSTTKPQRGRAYKICSHNIIPRDDTVQAECGQEILSEIVDTEVKLTITDLVRGGIDVGKPCQLEEYFSSITKLGMLKEHYSRLNTGMTQSFNELIFRFKHLHNERQNITRVVTESHVWSMDVYRLAELLLENFRNIFSDETNLILIKTRLSIIKYFGMGYVELFNSFIEKNKTNPLVGHFILRDIFPILPSFWSMETTEQFNIIQRIYLQIARM